MALAAEHGKLFVYGTLAPGEANEHWLQPLNGTWQPAWIRGVFYPNGIGLTKGFPAVDITGNNKIDGLLFESDQLISLWPRLDDFEGEGYRRTRVRVYFADGKIDYAYVYALNR